MLKLLPYPRSLRRASGTCVLPGKAVLYLDPALPRDIVLLPVAGKLQSAAKSAGIDLELITGPAAHPRLAIAAHRSTDVPDHVEAYTLAISPKGVRIAYREIPGLRAAAATLRQIIREHGKRLPCVTISDYPDFARRGIMLDISRGKVPKLETILTLLDDLANLKINEFQLYTEHTFAYRDYEPVWRGWGPLTGEEILRIDARCRQLGIELVPNQNSFGHLRYWLEYAPLKKLAETDRPWPDQGGAFLRRPATLAPANPGTMPFLRGLYDELLPHFTSSQVNVGCDETWDLGMGQSRKLCERRGKGQVYLDFLLEIHKEITSRGKQMLFWGDIILHYPDLVRQLPRDAIALNWGYNSDHPFEKETAIFAESGVPFYVCPGTSTWMSLIGRHDNGFDNLINGARIGSKNGAIGYLNTDWGDGGHPQPLAVSYLPYLLGAAVSWCSASYDESLLLPVADRDIFEDPSGVTAKAALALGLAHRKLDYFAPNVTPLGAVIAAPPRRQRELFCRDGLKYYARIPGLKIHAAIAEIETQRAILRGAAPATPSAKVLAAEFDFASRMALQSCKFMLWQQKIANGSMTRARQISRKAISELQQLDSEFNAYWPTRNKGTTAKCSMFLNWRIQDYKREVLSYPPAAAAVIRKYTSTD